MLESRRISFEELPFIRLGLLCVGILTFCGGNGSGVHVPPPTVGDSSLSISAAQWVSVVPGFNRVFKVHYKITYFGLDTHANKFQELPVMHVNPNVPNFFYYGGSLPWTNGALSQHVMP